MAAADPKKRYSPEVLLLVGLLGSQGIGIKLENQSADDTNKRLIAIELAFENYAKRQEDSDTWDKRQDYAAESLARQVSELEKRIIEPYTRREKLR